MTIHRVRSLIVSAVACLAVAGLSPEAHSQTKGNNVAQFGKGVGSGGGGIPTGPGASNATAGFNVVQVRDLLNQFKALANRGFQDGLQNKFNLPGPTQTEIVNVFRVLTGRANALLALLQNNGNINAQALALARQLDDLTNNLRDRARNLNSRELEDLARELERLADRVKDVID